MIVVKNIIKDYSNLDSRVIELVNQYKTYKYLRNLSYIPLLVESKSENPFDYLLTMEYFKKIVLMTLIPVTKNY